MKVEAWTFGCVLLLVVASFIPGTVGAYPPRYGPFETKQAPSSIPLSKCDLIRQSGKSEDGVAGVTCLYRDKHHPQWSVQLTGTTNSWIIELLDAQGKDRLCGVVTNRLDSSFVDVYSADLNQDRPPDFIVNVNSGGCGLAGEISEANFLVSSKNGYHATAFEMWDFGQQDLVVANQHHYLVLTRFIGGEEEKTRDHRDHNFWVYQLLRIDGDHFIPADAELPGFPKWVWYSYQDNHRETTLLTPAQKKRLLKKAERDKW